MGFSQKANQSKTTGGNSDYDAEGWEKWNKHIHEQHPNKKETKKDTKSIKTKTLIGVVNYVQDLGFPPAADNQWKVKEDHVAPADGEDYSQYELDFIAEHKAKNQHVDFVWADDWDSNNKKIVVRKQTSPSDPKQEYGICVDFPSWLVNFANHPNAKEDAADDWRPMRVSLNGKFMGDLQRPITFETNWKTGEVSDKNLVRKICAAAGLDQQLIDSDWDIGTIAEAVCNFKVKSDLNITAEGRCYYTASASTPAAIEDIELPDDSTYTAEAQKKKTLNVDNIAPFTGVLLNMDMEEYTDELLRMVHSTGTAHAFNKRAELSEETVKEGVSKAGKEYSITLGVDYKTTNFCKAYEKWLKAQDKANTKGTSTGSKKSEEKVDKKPEKVETKAVTKVNASKPEPIKSEPLPDEDWDDSIPF